MKLQILGVIAITTCLLASCTTEKHLQRNNLIVSADLSLSRDSSIQNWYREVIANSIIPKMGRQDGIVVTPTDMGSQTSGQEIFQKDFTRNDYSNEYAGLGEDEAMENLHKDSLRAAVRQLRTGYDRAVEARKELSGGTDIFGALKVAKQYWREGDSNMIIILCDMLQDTRPEDKLETRLQSPADIDKLIAESDRPDLTGFKIVVLTGKQPGISPDKFKLIQLFWEKYFTACHARLVHYSSGSVSMLEQIIQQNP